MKLILSDISLDISKDNLSHGIKYIDLTTKQIAPCIGCFGCWVKTPGKCVIRDDAITIYPDIAKCDHIIYISKVKYGSYDTSMKTLLERTIPTQQAFIRLYNGEAHHVQRNVATKQATIIAYGDISDDEKRVFSHFIDRNAHNLNFESHKVIFIEEDDLKNTVEREVSQWNK